MGQRKPKQSPDEQRGKNDGKVINDTQIDAAGKLFETSPPCASRRFLADVRTAFRKLLDLFG
jgi:hypothetical protein